MKRPSDLQSEIKEMDGKRKASPLKRIEMFNTKEGQERRLTGQHQIEDVRVLYPRKLKRQPWCLYCTKYKDGKPVEGNQTWLYCKICRASLCNGLFKTCFRSFHTQHELPAAEAAAAAEFS